MKVRLDLGVVLAAIYQIFLGSVEAYGNRQHCKFNLGPLIQD